MVKIMHGVAGALAVIGVAALAWAIAGAEPAWAHDPDYGLSEPAPDADDVPSPLWRRDDRHAEMSDHDAERAGMRVGKRRFADRVRNLKAVDGATRVLPNGTTDVWVHDRYAYLGTFTRPCGDLSGDNGSGIRIFDVHDNNAVGPEVGNIPPVPGSMTNDVKVAELNSGTILVHSNESCGQGVGGFEIWNVDEPTAPQFLGSVQTDDVNHRLRELRATDFGVHNLFLFTQGDRDYVAAVVESVFGNLQIFDITDPAAPDLVGFWGAEELLMAEMGLDPATVPDAEFGTIARLSAYLNGGFGASKDRFLHDVTVSADGETAYLSSWDAGLITLDIGDPSDPRPIAVALDVANGSIDGEVNSHAAWPSEDGSIVVEMEEDFEILDDGALPAGGRNAWGGLRIWDYSDPASPVLASTFNTVCSADPRDASCDPRGTYSAHNVIVETTGKRTKAYVSWYTDGVLVLDVTDPYNPVEVGRYHREGADFEADNGGIQDVWGIYKGPGRPWIYASDRNGGLYVLKEYGSSGKGRRKGRRKRTTH